MEVDNRKFIDKLCVFEPQSFYKFSALIRKKDFNKEEFPLKYSNKKEFLVKEWFVEDAYQLEKVKHDMEVYAKMLPCRIYLTLDRKSKKKTLINVRNRVNSYLDLYMNSNNPVLGIKSISKMISSASSVSESSDKDDRKYLFDIDSKDSHIVSLVEYMCDEEHIATLETINGFHVIAKKAFCPNDRGLQQIQKQLGENVIELKPNAMTLILKR